METCVGWGGGLLLLLLLLLWFGAGLGHGGLPENVVRCAFFVALHVGFHGKCSFCLSFGQLLCVFVDRRGGFHA